MTTTKRMIDVKIKIKKLSPDTVIPEYKHRTDAGFDLAAAEIVLIHPGQTVRVKTGLAFDIPDGYEMQIRPRSGLSAKSPIRVIVGTIDSGYHGEVSIIVELRALSGSKENKYPNYTGSYCIFTGDRIAQAIIAPVVHADFEEVDELDESERGTNGFGSTGVSG
ncbi:MAG: dUTP diphosphatase [Sporolactobacillus sp.]